MPPEHDYDVGYKKPPKQHRFKKGRSGNPKGRPRREKTFDSLLNRILDEKVAVTENGRHRKISKRQAIFKHLANRAAQGDEKAFLEVVRSVEASYSYNQKLETKEPPLPRYPSVIMSLPDNGRGPPRDPELTRRLVKTEREWYIEQEEKQTPANDNDDSVSELKEA